MQNGLRKESRQAVNVIKGVLRSVTGYAASAFRKIVGDDLTAPEVELENHFAVSDLIKKGRLELDFTG